MSDYEGLNAEITGEWSVMTSWRNLMNPNRPRTFAEEVLVQAIATASTHPDYSHLTPEAVYSAHVAAASRVVHDRKPPWMRAA